MLAVSFGTSVLGELRHRLTQNPPSTLFEVRAEQLCGGCEMAAREEAMSQLDPTARVLARQKREEKIPGRKQNPFLSSKS